MINEELRRELALKVAGIGTFDWDCGNQYFKIDPIFAEILGKKSGTLALDFKSFEAQIHPSNREIFFKTLESLKNSTLSAFESEIQVYRESKKVPEGKEWLWLKIKGQVVNRDSEEKPLTVLCTTMNISTQKLREQELSTEKKLLINGPTVVFKWRAAEGWPVEYVSPNIKREFGYRPEDFISGKIPYSTIIHPDDQEKVGKEILYYTKTCVMFFEHEYRIKKKDGEYRKVYDYTTILRDPSGLVTHYFGYIVDMTEQKLAEEKLRYENEAWLEAVCGMNQMNSSSIQELTKFAVEKILEMSNSSFAFAIEVGKEVSFVTISQNKNFYFSFLSKEECEKLTQQIKPVQEAIQTQQCYISSSIYEFAPEDNRLKDFSFFVQNYLAIPLIEFGKVDFVLLIGNRTRDYTQKEADKIQSLLMATRKISMVRTATEALRKSEERYRMVYNTAPIAFIYWNSSRGIIDWNKFAKNVFGWSKEEAIGKNFIELLIPDMTTEKLEEISKKLSTGEINSSLIAENLTKSGRIITCEWNNSVIFDEPEKPVAFLSLALDITEKLRMEAQLKEKLEEIHRINTTLSATNQELESFSYSVSHDLRAPLRALDGFSLALFEDYSDKLDGEARDYLERIRNSTVRMGNLIEGLLQLSRITRGTIEIREIDLGTIAKELSDELRESSPQRNATFEIQMPVLAKCDENLIRAALQNLLGNAWKFTAKQNETIISFGFIIKDADKVFYVRDNGAGFNMEYYGKLFGAFQRLHGTKEFEGTGIGLATVKRIISRHGGKIWAESKPNEGATFYFTLE
ncbi:MAG: PAS domain S-box protein [Candidatus Riflebacteria bacterium]|nr:PAS domain S-box protein [Candidatus Riflebacteria bacterium]